MNTEASAHIDNEVVDRAQWPYKMKDLCEKTGLPRQVLHFYIQQGLLPEGKKTGRNMAYYGEAHVERVRLIRQLQHERFLPLKAIKAMLEGQSEAFTPAQRVLLMQVKHRLDAARTTPRQGVLAEALLARTGLARRDLEELVEAGMLGTSEDAQGRTLVANDDAWMLELWGEMRSAGFTRELGFGIGDLTMLETAVSALFAQETELLTSRLSQLAPERVAEMVQRAIPVINTFLARYHETKIRNFFASI